MNPQNRKRLLVFLALGAFGILLADRWIIQPLSDLWAKRSERIQSLRQSITRGQSLLEREDVLARRWEDMRQSALPKDASDAEEKVEQATHRWINESGVTLSRIQPQWNPREELYRTYNCEANAEGNLESVFRFLYELETDSLPLYIEEVTIGSSDDKGEQLKLSLRFSGLQWIEENQQ